MHAAEDDGGAGDSILSIFDEYVEEGGGAGLGLRKSTATQLHHNFQKHILLQRHLSQCKIPQRQRNTHYCSMIFSLAASLMTFAANHS